MIKEVYIISNSNETINTIKEIFKKKKDLECNIDEYRFKNVKTTGITTALNNIPELIIIDEDNIDLDIIQLCKTIRADENNNITPIVVLSSNCEKEHRIQVLSLCVEYYIKKPMDEDYIYYTILNIIRLIYFNRRVSPLTGLPGNVQIHTELKRRLLNKESFAVLYLDLDNFKAYNDIYGFLKGDEIIKFTARTILKCVNNGKTDSEFVGHIGGDDFVAIMKDENYESVCQDIIAIFDKEVLKYFSQEDVERGYLEVANRKSIIEQFPLTSISVGVVVVDNFNKYYNILEIGEVGAQVKHLSKTIQGSSYVINRRNK